MNPKAYIEGLFAATPGLEMYDLSEGTNIYDLVIAPLKQIFEDAMGTGDIASIEEMRAWETLYDVPIEYLKKYAAIRGVQLRAKNYSSTLATLYFSEPIDWDIPAGSTLASGDTTFIVRDNVSITTGMLESKIDQRGLYYYSDLYLYNESGDNIDANTLGYITNAPPELMSIEHPAATNGIAEETVHTIIEKLRAKELSITASSPLSLKALVNRYYPGVDVCVVPPGDSKMTRDIVYNMVPGVISPKLESTYLGKIRRDNIANPNQAYYSFIQELTGAPDDDPEKEFTQGQYMAVNDAVDSEVTISTENVLNETFTQSSEKIGETSALIAMPAVPSRYLYVHDASKYTAGDSVNIADRTAEYPTQNGVVEASTSYTIAGTYTSATKKLEFTTTAVCPIISGTILYITIGASTYNGVVNTVTKDGNNYDVVLTTDILAEQTGAACTIDMQEVILYNNLTIEISTYTNMYVDIVNAEGLYIGQGWIKSEHGMPLGTYISENQICVINDELVMGAKMNMKEINVVKQVFLRYGLGNMLTKMFENLDISVSFVETPSQGAVIPQAINEEAF